MQRLISTSILASAAIFAVSPASASDIYTGNNPAGYAQPYSAPAPVNWTGFYLGGSVGWVNNNHNVSAVGQHSERQSDAACEGNDDVAPEPDATTDAGDACANADGTFVPATFAFVDAGSIGFDGLNSSGAVAGGTVGFDIQRGRFVFGAFADYDFSDASADLTVNGSPISLIEDGDRWVLAGRFGILFGESRSALLYALAGYGQQDATYGFIDDGLSKTVTHSGFVAGAGAEYALTDNVFVSLEWQHFFGDEETIAAFGADEPGPGVSRTLLKDEIDSDVVKGKLKIKLNSDVFGR